MTAHPTRPRRGHPRTRRHRRPAGALRRFWWTVATCLVPLAVGVAVVALGQPHVDSLPPSRGAGAGGPVANRLTPVEPDAAPAGRSARRGPAASPAAETGLQKPGTVPRRGDGTFTFASGQSAPLGRSGTMRRFRVAVEQGSGQDPDEFAASVEATLGDPRSWTGDGRTRLQRVTAGTGADFTVYLATGETASRMCLAGGVDIRVAGEPYTSCRAPGKVIINLSRWNRSVPQYVEQGIELERYRQYVINHEVGHELGHGHEDCPRAGRPAPVMVQQTLTLRGCRPYSWPRLDGERYAGPPA